MNNLPTTLLKLLAASLAVGMALSFFNIGAVELLGKLGVTPAELWERILGAINWAIPQIILGLLIVVPLWLLFFIFRPPR